MGNEGREDLGSMFDKMDRCWVFDESMSYAV